MEFNQWFYAAGVFWSILLAGLVAQKILRSRIKTDALRVVSLPFSGLILVLAFGIAIQFAPEASQKNTLVNPSLKVLAVALGVWLLERLVSLFVRSSRSMYGLTENTRALVLTIARISIVLIGLMIVLDTIGVSITPLLASLGVGSIAVALALQDTLSNLFGGFYILADKPVRIGDFVRVDNVDGHIMRIGWRSTRIRTGENDTVIVPNSKVASSQIRNYALPSPASVLQIPCRIAYGTDLNTVERAALEVAEAAVQRFSVLDKTYSPSVRFSSFGDFGLQFSLIVRVLNFSDAGFVRHELIKALYERFQSEKIEIPTLQRVNDWNQQANP